MELDSLRTANNKRKKQATTAISGVMATITNSCLDEFDRIEDQEKWAVDYIMRGGVFGFGDGPYDEPVIWEYTNRRYDAELLTKQELRSERAQAALRESEALRVEREHKSYLRTKAKLRERQVIRHRNSNWRKMVINKGDLFVVLAPFWPTRHRRHYESVGSKYFLPNKDLPHFDVRKDEPVAAVMFRVNEQIAAIPERFCWRVPT